MLETVGRFRIESRFSSDRDLSAIPFNEKIKENSRRLSVATRDAIPHLKKNGIDFQGCPESH